LKALTGIPMSQANDVWYVRLPDGRVVRARSTAAVRHHIETGRIPFDSRVRRDPEDDWVTLDWSPEFADLVVRRPARANGAGEKSLFGARGQEHELRQVGVRGLVEELLAALDSALTRRKLLVAGVSGFCAGLVLLLIGLWPSYFPTPWPWLPWVVGCFGLFFVTSYCAALLTQMTVVEVSRLRPATREEARAGLGRHLFRLMLVNLVVGGSILFTIFGLRWLPDWILAQHFPEGWPHENVLAGIAVALRLILEVLLWPTLVLTLLLGPAIIVEDSTTWSALRQWCTLLRRKLNRVLLYEALAVALGLITALPILLPVLIAGRFEVSDPTLVFLHDSVFLLLVGLALTPLISYLVVANVFIYLTVRYEFTPYAKVGGTP
jgi:hypothetical protein